MNVCLFGGERAADTVASLERIIRAVIPEESFRAYRKIHDLAARLRDPRQKTEIAVLVAADAQDLQEFILLRELSDAVRIVLVLGAGEAEMIKQGHRLLPRFLTYADADLAMVGAVLEKLTKPAPQVGAEGVDELEEWTCGPGPRAVPLRMIRNKEEKQQC